MATTHRWKKYNYNLVKGYKRISTIISFGSNSSIESGTSFDMSLNGYSLVDVKSHSGFESSYTYVLRTDSSLVDMSGSKDLIQTSKTQSTGTAPYLVYIKSVYGGDRDHGNQYYANCDIYDSPRRIRGSYVGEVFSTNGNSYPRNGYESDGFWYVYDGILNQAPTISGSDVDLGAKTDNFNIEYVVQDDKESSLTVSLKVDNTVLFTENVTTGIKNTKMIDVSNLALGQHTVIVEAKDSEGLTSQRRYTFNKVNSAPFFGDDIDRDLGAKNSAFTVVYSVDDLQKNKVDIVEKLNGEVLLTRENVTLQTEYSITISQEALSALKLNERNTIEIEARDKFNAVAYRRYYFTRTNAAPVISGTDSDLGEIEKTLSLPYSATDAEGDEITLSVYLDTQEMVSPFVAEDNKEYTFTIDKERFARIGKGRHTIKIVAVDALGLKSQRLYTYTAIAKRLIVMDAKIKDSENMPTRAVVSCIADVSVPDIEKMEITNNANDESPVWEDCTEIVNQNRPYYFTNTKKTEDHWGVRQRYTVLEKSSKETTYFSGMGGSYEVS